MNMEMLLSLTGSFALIYGFIAVCLQKGDEGLWRHIYTRDKGAFTHMRCGAVRYAARQKYLQLGPDHLIPGGRLWFLTPWQTFFFSLKHDKLFFFTTWREQYIFILNIKGQLWLLTPWQTFFFLSKYDKLFFARFARQSLKKTKQP